MERIAIIGLGLIGGSIGLGLKRANLPETQVIGTARTRNTVQRAKKRGAIDVEARSPAEAVEGARVVIVAAPILSIRQIFEDIAPALSPGAVVTDAASTKGDVMRWAGELLPTGVAHFVGGHPMAGKESQGIDVADADLFRGKPWVICPSVNADDAAIRTVVGMAQQLGAQPMFMDPDEHDSYVAAISHLPLVLSSALFSVAFGSAAWPELAQLASSGFQDTTRLASGSPEMAHDIVKTNRDNLLHWIERYEEELARFKEVIRSAETEPVLEAFTRAQLERDNFMINGAPDRTAAGEPIEAISFSDMLLGSKIASMMRKQEELLRGAESRIDDKRRR